MGLIICLITIPFCFGPVNAFSESPETLDELPFTSLLKKRSVLLEQVSHNHIVGDRSEVNVSTNQPFAEALVNPIQHMQVRRKGPIDRGHFEEVEEEEEEWEWMPMMSKGKLSGIFDGSITVLSFLAFGGYLICLLFNVVREKENNKASSTKASQLYQQLISQANQKPTFNLRPAGRRRRRGTLQVSSTDVDFDLLLLTGGNNLFARGFNSSNLST